MSNDRQKDVVVVGGGMFGTWTACMAAARGLRTVLLEAGSELHQAASLVNQARVHNGYHYPRSILTGIRSRANFERFAEDFPEVVHSAFTHLYAIARQGSHITAQQFALFCERIGAECTEVDDIQHAVFDRDRVEAVFRVKEYAFDAEVLRKVMRDKLMSSGAEVRMSSRVASIEHLPDGHMTVVTGAGEHYNAAVVFNCTYAALNAIARSAGVPAMAFRQELVEIALMRMPPELRTIGWTIMDGPFSSSLPFPARQARSLYHVKHSVHYAWDDDPSVGPVDGASLLIDPPASRVRHMVQDGALYVPGLRNAEHVGSLWTVRTKLPGSAQTDSRPILFRNQPEQPRLYHVMGGKIDNVYDLEEYLENALSEAFGTTRTNSPDAHGHLHR